MIVLGRIFIGVKIWDKVQDKVIVIIGGVWGIGLVIVVVLYNLGVKVVIGDIDEVMVKELGVDFDFDMYGKFDVIDLDLFLGFFDVVEC